MDFPSGTRIESDKLEATGIARPRVHRGTNLANLMNEVLERWPH